MTKRNLPAYVYTKKGVLYFQRRGYPTTRIASAPGSPEFHAEYARLVELRFERGIDDRRRRAG